MIEALYKLKRKEREYEDLYKKIVQWASDGVILIQDHKMVFINPQLARMVGYKPEELLNQPFIKFIHKSEQKKVGDFYNRRMAGKYAPEAYETIAIHKNGKKVYLEINTSKITYRGKTAGMGIVRNITDRKKAEAQKEKYTLELERRVKKRTKELDKKNKILENQIKELQKFHKITIGREMVMVELKNKIKELKDRFKK